MVEATSLDELAESHFLALQVTLENDQLPFKRIVFVLGACLQLFDGYFNLAVHVVLLLHGLLVFFFQLYLLLADVFEALLNIFEASFGVTVAHHVDFVVGYLFLTSCLFLFIFLKRAFHQHTVILKFFHNDFRVLDLQFDVLIPLLETLDDV